MRVSDHCSMKGCPISLKPDGMACFRRILCLTSLLRIPVTLYRSPTLEPSKQPNTIILPPPCLTSWYYTVWYHLKCKITCKIFVWNQKYQTLIHHTTRHFSSQQKSNFCVILAFFVLSQWFLGCYTPHQASFSKSPLHHWSCHWRSCRCIKLCCDSWCTWLSLKLETLINFTLDFIVDLGLSVLFWPAFFPVSACFLMVYTTVLWVLCILSFWAISLQEKPSFFNVTIACIIFSC